MISEAAKFAKKAHEGQFRKYGSGEPYLVHPMRVADVVSIHEKATDEMVAAAWLHDTVEDCDVTVEEIRELFGTEVGNLVMYLTNPSKGMVASREIRKSVDRQWLAKVPWEAKLIKLVDRLDNLKDMAGDTKVPYGFKQLYRQESVLLLEEALTCVDSELWNEAMSYAKESE